MELNQLGLYDKNMLVSSVRVLTVEKVRNYTVFLGKKQMILVGN
jgi:hypothetical protein